MKKNLLKGLVLLSMLTVSVSSCKKENEAPTASVDYKSSNYTFTVNASDEDGSIQKVEFIYDGDVVKTDYSAPYQYQSEYCGSNRKFTIVVYDNDGKTTTVVKTVSIPC